MPGDIVLHGDPAAPTKGHSTPMPKGWMDQDATWHRGRSRQGTLSDGDPAPLPWKRYRSSFGPMSIVAKRSPISATAEHLLHSSQQSVIGYIGATWQIRLNSCFLQPTRVHNPNGKWITSAISAQLMAGSPYTLLPPKLPLLMGDLDPHLTYNSLGHTEPTI